MYDPQEKFRNSKDVYLHLNRTVNLWCNTETKQKAVKKYTNHTKQDYSIFYIEQYLDVTTNTQVLSYEKRFKTHLTR